jgi:hypothetical protein
LFPPKENLFKVLTVFLTAVAVLGNRVDCFGLALSKKTAIFPDQRAFPL